MAPFTLLQLALATTGAVALSVPAERDIKPNHPGFVSMPITRRERPTPSLRRRDNDVPLYNVSSVSYLIELNIGTPGQPVRVAIDTGSDELWINPDCTTTGFQELTEECLANGQYDPTDSSTSTVTSVEGYIAYGRGEVQFQYVLDNITLADSTLEISQQVFGVATASVELSEGILGLSYGQPSNTEYPNFVDELFLQQQTNTRSFSIALGSKDFDNGGTLIFGGVDTKKFVGDLVSRPILGPQFGEPINRYWIDLDSVAFSGGSGSPYPMDTIPIVLDSGSTLSYLPSSVVRAMATDLDGTYDRSNDLYLVDCDVASRTDTMDFTFGNVTIKVPMYEFIWEALTDQCVLGAIGVTDADIMLLGDSFMRAGYFVFDQDNGFIHMAQYANCGENEQAIPTDGIATSFSGECEEGDIPTLPGSNIEDGNGGDSTDGGNEGDNSNGGNSAGALMSNFGLSFTLAVAIAFSLV